MGKNDWRKGRRNRYDGRQRDNTGSQQPVATSDDETGFTATDYTPPDGEMTRPRRRGGEGSESSDGWNRNLNRSMREMFMNSRADVTIAIKTRNSEDYLVPLLQNLSSQVGPYTTEILAFDCDSTDRTPLILRSRGIRNFPLTSQKRWRESAAKIADGRVIVFLTYDTLPFEKHWLKRLVKPLFDDPRVVACQGRLLPDSAVPPYPRGLIQARQYLSGRKTFAWCDSPAGKRLILPASNVAIRTEALREAGAEADCDDAVLKMWSSGNRLRAYVAEAPAVIRRGEALSTALLPVKATDPRSLVTGLGCETRRLVCELRELGESSELGRGERADAYLAAITLATARVGGLFAGHMNWLTPVVEKTSTVLARIKPGTKKG